MLGAMPPPMINSFLDQRRFSNGFSNGAQMPNNSWQYQAKTLQLKDFLTTSSNLLEKKKDRIRSSKEWFLRQKPFNNKNIALYPNGREYYNKGRALGRPYVKPQSAKRPMINTNSLNAYKERFVCQQPSGLSSRNFNNKIDAQSSNPVKANKLVIVSL